MVQAFTLKVWQTEWSKDWTLKTSSEKFTLTCVYAYAFHESGFISVYYNHEILVGVRLSESFRRFMEGEGLVGL